MRRLARHPGLATLAALVLIASSGCHPGISWLPDSSGFVYTKGKHLMLFDVKTKKSQVLAKDLRAPAWPTVSPDGKRFALTRVWHRM